MVAYGGTHVECLRIRSVQGQNRHADKFVAVATSQHHPKESLKAQALAAATTAQGAGFDALLLAHKARWEDIWSHSDIVIEGDGDAQQGIRFNIFHLNQTYTGDDERLNIGPKGFTGEKYGGSTYWDTEAFCIPFFLSTAPSSVTRNLLIYRYKHLEKAIENARKLGFGGGAALYPMVTMNGEECHNEWEITFEEIHRNGAIAYAIFNYIRHTQDENYLADYGLEVLIGIARFWAQRASFSPEKGKYVILGVTGPNEYENNVNNNWYTNTIACWCMDYRPRGAGEGQNATARNATPKSWRRRNSIRPRNRPLEGRSAPKCISRYDEKLEHLSCSRTGISTRNRLVAKDLDARGAAHQPALELGPHPAFALHQTGRHLHGDLPVRGEI